MTAIVEGAKKMLGLSGPALPDRVKGLQVAVHHARGRLNDELVDRAEQIAGRAAERLAMTGGYTVVGLAGSTGSGKSSTFNSLADLELAAVGVRRPTTSWTMSCTWGGGEASELLEWLGVPRRHQVSRASMLDVDGDSHDLDGLVLLDLPDHDSTELGNHLEVDRLVKLVDMLVWVVDPQKYADAAIHDRYLKPLAIHKDVMFVVLNHIDEVPVERRDAMVADLRRLLDADGLHEVPVLATSAIRGDGIAELRRIIAKRVSSKRATTERLLGDVEGVAKEMEAVNGSSRPGDIARASKAELVDAFADAGGVPMVVKAVRKASVRRAGQTTGWPVTAWLSKLRPDPLRRLHLDLGASGKQLTAASRASLPAPTLVQRARADTAARAVADNVAAQLSPPWAEAVHRASTSRLEDLNDALDAAVTSTDLGVSRVPIWWRLVRVLQLLLVLGAVAGGLWLAGLAVMGYLKLEEPTTPKQLGFPIPTLMLLGGVAAGVLIGISAKLLARLSAGKRARSASSRLHAAIAQVTEDLVILPIEAELEAYRQTRHGLNAALR